VSHNTRRPTTGSPFTQTVTASLLKVPSRRRAPASIDGLATERSTEPVVLRYVRPHINGLIPRPSMQMWQEAPLPMLTSCPSGSAYLRQPDSKGSSQTFVKQALVHESSSPRRRNTESRQLFIATAFARCVLHGRES